MVGLKSSYPLGGLLWQHVILLSEQQVAIFSWCSIQPCASSITYPVQRVVLRHKNKTKNKCKQFISLLCSYWDPYNYSDMLFVWIFQHVLIILLLYRDIMIKTLLSCVSCIFLKFPHFQTFLWLMKWQICTRSAHPVPPGSYVLKMTFHLPLF